MPNYFEWYLPKRVILGHSIGEIIEKDLIEQNQILKQMLDEGQKPVHFLLNLNPQGPVLVPISILIKHAGYLKHSNFGWALTYGQYDNRLVRFITASVGQAMGIHFRSVNTYQEALKFLLQVDHTLDFNDLSPPVLRSAGELGGSFCRTSSV